MTASPKPNPNPNPNPIPKPKPEVNNAPKLDAPGKGLPLHEYLIARYILFPRAVRKMTRKKAVSYAIKTGKQIIEAVEALPEQQRSQPVLIKRLAGLEDSSRFWSANMVIEHLVITHKAMFSFAQQLANGKIPDIKVGTADVKPEGKREFDDLVREYNDLLDQYTDAVAALPDNLKNKAYRHEHPWFGPMTSYQWLCLNAIHPRIHVGQINEIINKL